MLVEVKTEKLEFDSAESYSYVYGYIIRTDKFPVYIELGEEKDYNPSQKDNEKTEYRLFLNCRIFISETDEELDAGNYVQTIDQATVKIFY